LTWGSEQIKCTIYKHKVALGQSCSCSCGSTTTSYAGCLSTSNTDCTASVCAEAFPTLCGGSVTVNPSYAPTTACLGLCGTNSCVSCACYCCTATPPCTPTYVDTLSAVSCSNCDDNQCMFAYDTPTQCGYSGGSFPNGHAATISPVCTSPPANCSALDAPQFGSWACPVISVGNGCVQDCTYGVASGSNVRMCSNGVWSNLVCNGPPCSALPTPAFGSGSCPNTYSGDACTQISCLHGVSSGSSTLTCTNGVWSSLTCNAAGASTSSSGNNAQSSDSLKIPDIGLHHWITLSVVSWVPFLKSTLCIVDV